MIKLCFFEPVLRVRHYKTLRKLQENQIKWIVGGKTNRIYLRIFLEITRKKVEKLLLWRITLTKPQLSFTCTCITNSPRTPFITSIQSQLPSVVTENTIKDSVQNIVRKYSIFTYFIFVLKCCVFQDMYFLQYRNVSTWPTNCVTYVSKLQRTHARTNNQSLQKGTYWLACMYMLGLVDWKLFNTDEYYFDLGFQCISNPFNARTFVFTCNVWKYMSERIQGVQGEVISKAVLS